MQTEYMSLRCPPVSTEGGTVTAADRVEKALAEGRQPDPEDVDELVADSKDLAAIRTMMAALGKPRKR